MAQALSRAVESAERINRAVSGAGVAEATRAILDLRQAELDFQASSSLVKVQKELDRSVLDLLA